MPATPPAPLDAGVAVGDGSPYRAELPTADPGVVLWGSLLGLGLVAADTPVPVWTSGAVGHHLFCVAHAGEVAHDVPVSRIRAELVTGETWTPHECLRTYSRPLMRHLYPTRAAGWHAVVRWIHQALATTATSPRDTGSPSERWGRLLSLRQFTRVTCPARPTGDPALDAAAARHQRWLDDSCTRLLAHPTLRRDQAQTLGMVLALLQQNPDDVDELAARGVDVAPDLLALDPARLAAGPEAGGWDDPAPLLTAGTCWVEYTSSQPALHRHAIDHVRTDGDGGRPLVRIPVLAFAGLAERLLLVCADETLAPADVADAYTLLRPAGPVDPREVAAAAHALIAARTT